MKKLSVMLVTLIACVNLSGCSGSGFIYDTGVGQSTSSRPSDDYYGDGVGVAGYGDLGLGGNSSNSTAMEVQALSSSGIKADMDSGSGMGGSKGFSKELESPSETTKKKQNNQKLIRSVSIKVEIPTSDRLNEAVNNLTELTESYDGWVAYNNVDFGSRYAGGTLEVRVPKDRVDEFIATVEESELKVLNKSDNVKDVTMEYVDTTSRLKVKETQRDKYMEYLNQATNVTELLEIEDRLADVISDIEAYQQKINSMDSLIEYTEIEIGISCETSVNRESFWERFKAALRDIRESVSETFLGGLEWFLNALITLIYVIPIIIIVIRTVVLALKGGLVHKDKKDKSFKDKVKDLIDKVKNVSDTKNKTESKEEKEKSEEENK